MGKKLSSAFFLKPTLLLAESLLGKKLITWKKDKRTGRSTEVSGMIVEVEAYTQDGDMASHSWRGKTPRNRVMFQAGGHCYVYFIYGMHHCINVVSESEGTGAAVLIRALQPISGLHIMQRRRHVKNPLLLTNGPAKICQALGISKAMCGEHFLRSKRIQLRTFRKVKKSHIVRSKRIGISRSQDLPWRFSIRNNPWVSRAA